MSTSYLVSTDTLRSTLDTALQQHYDASQHIRRFERRPSPRRSSFALDELDVQLANGTRLPMIFKDLSRRSMLAEARRLKPAFLYDPLREISVYQTILATAALGTPTCYAAVVDPTNDRYWLFLERVAGRELYATDLCDWCRVAVWLAHTHTALAGSTHTATGRTHLLHYDRAWYHRWMRRMYHYARQTTPARHHAIVWLRDCYKRVIERLVDLPKTIIHGECYAANVLVQPTPAGLRVSPVDWELTALAPGLIDLAALTSGTWTPAERHMLEMTYYTSLAPNSPCWMPHDRFLAALTDCRLHIAVQWLGWAAHWSPPPEHAQDWLRQALDLAEEIHL